MQVKLPGKPLDVILPCISTCMEAHGFEHWITDLSCIYIFGTRSDDSTRVSLIWLSDVVLMCLLIYLSKYYMNMELCD